MTDDWLERLRRDHPEKLRPLDEIFARIRRGQRIFIGTGCGEPQFLARSLAEYAREHPKAIFDAELFRLNAFFVGDGARDAVNRGLADYTPVFLSQVPDLFRRGLVPVDVALIQTTPPDEHGYVNLGISVDIVRAAVESAAIVVAQVNENMPWLDGDGSIPLSRID
nr:acetyl-CoA hydrolase [Acidobacteriota bacterium]